MPEEIKGKFITTIEEFANSENEIVACFCYGDLKQVSILGKKAIFGDHGIGMFYNTTHPSYAGSTEHRECVILRLSPNEIHAKKEREVLTCPVEVIGVPKMDKWHYLREQSRQHIRRRPTIAISFHWDCMVVPETRSAYRFYFRILRQLADSFPEQIIGHAHPRIWGLMQRIYRSCGIRSVEKFEDVMKQADIYICDNSSTIFEFAYLKKPVILLNQPMYRRNVEHEGNPRFWRMAGMGEQVNTPEEIFTAIQKTIDNPRWEETEKAVEEMFVFLDGKSSKRSADIINNFIKKYEKENKCSDNDVSGS